MIQTQVIARWIKGEIPSRLMPWQIDIDLSNQCNQDCYYCNTAGFRASDPSTPALPVWQKLFTEIREWQGVRGVLSNVIFSGGGEPTLLKGYHHLVKQCIDDGYSVAINTNGTNLRPLIKLGLDYLTKMAYIGVDIDSAVHETYELIRRSRGPSPYHRVVASVAELGHLRAPVDIKALLLPENTSRDEIHQLFALAAKTGARSLHFRPGVINNTAFEITAEIQEAIASAAASSGVQSEVAVGRYEPRQYSRCHQMFLFPSFCADGYIYLCCEYKGREDLRLCSWVQDDWRAIWGSSHHRALYERFTTHFCKPCRPNQVNNLIEADLQNPTSRLAGFI